MVCERIFFKHERLEYRATLWEQTNKHKKIKTVNSVYTTKKKHPYKILMFYINTLQVPSIVFATRERCCNCHTIWALYWDYCVCGVFYFPLAPPFPVNNNTVCTMLINMHTTNSYLQVHNLSTVLQKNSLPWDGPLTSFLNMILLISSFVWSLPRSNYDMPSLSSCSVTCVAKWSNCSLHIKFLPKAPCLWALVWMPNSSPKSTCLWALVGALKGQTPPQIHPVFGPKFEHWIHVSSPFECN